MNVWNSLKMKELSKINIIRISKLKGACNIVIRLCVPLCKLVDVILGQLIFFYWFD